MFFIYWAFQCWAEWLLWWTVLRSQASRSWPWSVSGEGTGAHPERHRSVGWRQSPASPRCLYLLPKLFKLPAVSKVFSPVLWQSKLDVATSTWICVPLDHKLERKYATEVPSEPPVEVLLEALRVHGLQVVVTASSCVLYAPWVLWAGLRTGPCLHEVWLLCKFRTTSRLRTLWNK